MLRFLLANRVGGTIFLVFAVSGFSVWTNVSISIAELEQAREDRSREDDSKWALHSSLANASGRIAGAYLPVMLRCGAFIALQARLDELERRTARLEEDLRKRDAGNNP